MNDNRLPFNNSIVFPFSYENFMAIIKAYFYQLGISTDGPESIDKVYKKALSVSLGEFDFIIRIVHENISFFKHRLGPSGLTISNLTSYALDAYLGTVLGKTTNRASISNDFREILSLEILKRKSW